MNQELLLQQFRLNKSFSKAQKIFIKREGVFMREGVYYALRNSFYGKKTTEKQFSTKISKIRVKYIKGLGYKNMEVQEKRVKKLEEAEKNIFIKEGTGDIKQLPEGKFRTNFRWGHFDLTKEEAKERAKDKEKQKDSPKPSARGSTAKDGIHSLQKMKELTGYTDYLSLIKNQNRKIIPDKGGFRYIIYTGKGKNKDIVKDIELINGEIRDNLK